MVFLRFYGRGKLVPHSDWPQYEERLPDSYTPAELTKFFQHATTDRQHLLLELLNETGFRHGELSHLTVGDIDWDRCRLRVRSKEQWGWKVKTNEAREIRVKARVITALQAWVADHPGQDLIFANRQGRPDEHLDRVVQEIAKRAGITGRVDCHKIRSTCATPGRAFLRFRMSAAYLDTSLLKRPCGIWHQVRWTTPATSTKSKQPKNIFALRHFLALLLGKLSL
jgi:integrase